MAKNTSKPKHLCLSLLKLDYSLVPLLSFSASQSSPLVFPSLNSSLNKQNENGRWGISVFATPQFFILSLLHFISCFLSMTDTCLQNKMLPWHGNLPNQCWKFLLFCFFLSFMSVPSNILPTDWSGIKVELTWKTCSQNCLLEVFKISQAFHLIASCNKCLWL